MTKAKSPKRVLGPFGPKDHTIEQWREERMKRGANLLTRAKHPGQELDTGALIEGVRTIRGLSQTQLAERVGCTQKHISKLEDGISCNVTMLERIAKAAGATLKIEFIP